MTTGSNTLDLLLIVTTIDDVIRIIDNLPADKLTGREAVKAVGAKKELRTARAFINTLIDRERQFGQ